VGFSVGEGRRRGFIVEEEAEEYAEIVEGA